MSGPFPGRVDRCPLCKRGEVLEWTMGWYCSRRYAKRNPCDWEKIDAGPNAAQLEKEAATREAHAAHVRKYRRQRAMQHPGMLGSRPCNGCGGSICCYYGQRTVLDPKAPGGVWLLHPACSPPGTTTHETTQA